MLDTKIYYPTPELGYNGSTFYETGRYHVAPLPKLDSLTLSEAQMIANFMNGLVNERSRQAVKNRVMMNRGVYGIDRLLGGDLGLMVDGDAIVWDEGSLLEELENEQRKRT